MRTFADYRDHVGANSAKFFKSTLFQSERLLLGLNCLEPGQEQHVHTHAGQDKFYFVVLATLAALMRAQGLDGPFWDLPEGQAG